MGEGRKVGKKEEEEQLWTRGSQDEHLGRRERGVKKG